MFKYGTKNHFTWHGKLYKILQIFTKLLGIDSHENLVNLMQNAGTRIVISVTKLFSLSKNLDPFHQMYQL
jgi:hypothetical protein